MSETIRVSTTLPATLQRIYQAWLDSAGHTAITGSPAEVNPAVGGKFSAWDGYIQGVTLELEPDRRIVQAWRTSDFPHGSPDSRLEVLLEPFEGGTRITLVHTEIPDGQGQEYAQGWEDFYFAPMKAYFSGSGGE
jgi:activator of HSP90 ATPase